MKFLFSEENNSLCGSLIYRESEYSLDFICASTEKLKKKSGSQGCMSLTVGTVQIEVGVETGSLLYPWGLLSLVSCERKKIELPSFKEGTINIHLEQGKLISGVSFDIPGSNAWETILDSDGEWIYIGDAKADFKRISFVEFAAGTVVGISDDGGIFGFFIKPVFVI